MKWTLKLAAAAALGVAALATPVLAQERHDRDRDQATRRDTDRVEMRQSHESARREAIAAYAQAKRECSRERRDERAHCMRAAKEDYDHQMAETRRR